MPRELLMVRRGSFLQPATRFDEEAMSDLPIKTAITVSISKTPSTKMRAWYRALLTKVTEATGAWPTPDQAHRQLLVRCGFMESMVISQSGDIRVTPESTADWDRFRWQAYLDVLIQVLVEEHFGNIKDRILLREVEQFVGIRYEEIER